MSAPKNPKRNHHHVWQAYLKPWVSDGRIWCQEGGEATQKRTKTVAVDRDFYQLNPLNKFDIHALEQLIQLGSPSLQSLNRGLLNLLMEGFRKYAQFPAPTDAMRQHMLKYQYETLENYHSSIENSFAPILARLRAGDISFYETDEVVTFIRFICTQSTRTKGFKEKSLERIAALDRSVDFSRIWNILIHIFANNIGRDLYAERKRRALQILRNESCVPFITSDQPVINAKVTIDGKPATSLAYFYPIAPNRALYLGDIDDAPLDEEVTEDKAKALNAQMQAAAYAQLFANEKSHFCF